MPPRTATGQFTKSPTPGTSTSTMSGDSSPSALDVAALVEALRPMIASEISSAIGPAIAAEVSSAIAAGLPGNPPQTVPPTPQAPAAQHQHHAAAPPFVGPLTTNQAAGASHRLLTLFPEVEEAVIIAIVTHQFRAAELYKLDSRYRDKMERQTLEVDNGSVRVKTDSSVRDYPTPTSIELPMLVYIRILVAHCSSNSDASTINLHFLSYIESFLKIRSEYDWPAVLNYHMAFFARRRREMAQGDYSGWRKTDAELQTDYLVGYRKARTTNTPAQPKRTGEPNARTAEVCRIFNLGTCASPCRNGRIHKCTTCNKADHGSSACTQATRA